MQYVELNMQTSKSMYIFLVIISKQLNLDAYNCIQITITPIFSLWFAQIIETYIALHKTNMTLDLNQQQYIMKFTKLAT